MDIDRYIGYLVGCLGIAAVIIRMFWDWIQKANRARRDAVETDNHAKSTVRHEREQAFLAKGYQDLVNTIRQEADVLRERVVFESQARFQAEQKNIVLEKQVVELTRQLFGYSPPKDA